jgi:pyruvate/2-oxoglutarate dehydrogenase complex dihydrolipoamide dehydrogenase (E3) component
MIKSRGYDAVLVAVGADPIIPRIPGAEGENVWNVLNVYGKEKDLGKNVAVVGGGAIGVETGMYLAKYGHKVTLLTSERRPVVSTGPHQLSPMINAYQRMDNLIPVTEAVTTRISDGKVTYRDASGSEKSIRADSVVIYSGFKPLQDEALKFSGSAAQFFIIGECNGLGNGVQKSQRSAFFAASQV